MNHGDRAKQTHPSDDLTDRQCQWDGCEEVGKHKAPKDRSLRDYYVFCLEHVRTYNAEWNFHDGLGEDVMEQEFRSAATWDRPTWKMGQSSSHGQPWQNILDPFELFQEAYGTEAPSQPAASAQTDSELSARQVFNLHGAFTMTALKARYKELVKLHHPDANGGSEDAENKMKTINAAYQTLRAWVAE